MRSSFDNWRLHEAAPRIAKQGARKGECDRCGVNLRPGYGYKVDGTLMCVTCAEKKVGKEAVQAAEKGEAVEIREPNVVEASQTYVQAQQAIMAGLAKDGWTIKAALKVPQALSPDKSYKLFFKAQAIYLGQGDSDLGNARSLHLADIRGGTYEKFKADLARWTKTESKQHGCGCEGECECSEAEGDTGRSDMEKVIFKSFPPDSKRKKGGKAVVMFTGSVAKAAGVLDYTSMPLSDLTDKQVKAVYALVAKKESVEVEVASEFRERAGIAGAHGNWRLE